ncbi:MAG: 50S ribosomal protein L22 [Acidobacteria bacterium]|nr:50S ribosomal protein L22 [Acidobacteriota bacterium]
MEGRATARYVRTSAQKAKLVMDLIRGQNVDQALSTLRFARKRIARDIEKVLRSAVANAQQKDGASGDADQMYVSKCYADQGPSQKRIRPAPMGRAFRIIKRTAHLTVHVAERLGVTSAVTVTTVEPEAQPVADAIVDEKSKKQASAKRGRAKDIKKKAAKQAADDEIVTGDAAAADESAEAEEASADIAEQAGADEGRAKDE